MNYLSVLIFIPLVLVGLLLPVLIGVLVYRDAQRRGMDALLWALVAALVPSFVGLIIYLVVCRNEQGLTCGNCGGEVKESYTVCPRCGSPLKLRCEACGEAVEGGWTACAACGQGLDPEESPTVHPAPRDNRGLVALLVVLVVMLLVVLGVVALLTFRIIA